MPRGTVVPLPLQVPLIPGGVVCNIGVTLQKMSKGAMVATTHRVNTSKIRKRRVSVPFFQLPRLDGDLLPMDVKIAPKEFTRFTTGDVKSALNKRTTDRGRLYEIDRMNLFFRSARLHYPKEYAELQQKMLDARL